MADSDMIKGLNKCIDAATGKTGDDYTYLYNTPVTEKLDELADAIAAGGGGGGASALSDLTDVDISGSVQGGKVLKYNAVEEKWTPGDDSGNVQSDWNENDPTSGAFILNKPSVPNSPIELTQAEYDALTPAEKMSDTPYFITDANGDGSQFQPVIYSTTEREIGVWIDGKPLYEKTQYISALPSSVDEWVNYPHGISNFDRLISVSATAYNSDVPQQFNIPHVSAMGGTPTIAGQITISVSDTDIAFIVGQDRSSWEAYVTIQYTKTTDTAGSGTWTPQGVPAVHYSTNERIVGTWIDGSTVYERTISVGELPDSSTKIIETIPSIKEIIDFSSFAVSRTIPGYCYPIPFSANPATDNIRLDFRNYELRIITYGYWSSYDGYITIRYTKSST